jgi:hypothetical protein
MDLSSRQDRLLGTLEGFEPNYHTMGLAISPDGTTMLYSRRVLHGSDLMLIENFK